MFSLKPKKYKLIQGEVVNTPALANRFSFEDNPIQMYRVQALRDIPEHGVKAGDIGGLVEGKWNLSQSGSCWIADEATVFGEVFIDDNAYIGDTAKLACVYKKSSVTVKDNAKVYGNALVYAKPLYSDSKNVHTVISDYAEVSGDTLVANTQYIQDHAKVYGEAWLENAYQISDYSHIFGKAELSEFASTSGNSKIYGSVLLQQNTHAIDAIIYGYGCVEAYTTVHGGEHLLVTPDPEPKTDDPALGEAFGEIVEGMPEVYDFISPKATRAMKLFDEVSAELAAYETDIVKIIQYPAMTDRSVPETRDMIVALKLVKRLADDPENDEFSEAVADLEKKFLTAESVALKMASTSLSAPDKKKTELAKDLLAVAENEASTEHEKKVAFQQAFKQLEGVINVPEIAVETFRIKIGLKELESL